jgi:pyruvate/oxaloacetate carboxyltransferase
VRCCTDMELNLMNAMFGIEAQPFWGGILFLQLPRFVREQPWALLRNPFGIVAKPSIYLRQLPGIVCRSRLLVRRRKLCGIGVQR